MRIETYGKPHTAEQIASLSSSFVETVAQRSRGELQDILNQRGVTWEITKFLDRLSGYSCDWVDSTVDYPVEYAGLRPVEEQVALVADEFQLARGPALKIIKAGLPKLPQWMEGWVAVPIEWMLRQKSYPRTLEKAVLWMNRVTDNKPGCYAGCFLGGLNPWEHICPEYAHPDYLSYGHQAWKHDDFLSSFYRKFDSKIALMPVQMGRMRRGQSDRMAREQCKRNEREFPATAFETACLLAMHPKRIGTGNTLKANSPGDVFLPAAQEKIGIGNQADHLQMVEFRKIEDSSLITMSIGFESLKNKTNAPITFSTWDLRSVSL